jgi:prepilin peptidase CpaA
MPLSGSQTVVNYAPLIVVGSAVLVAAVIDLWKFKIHNLLTFPLFLSGVVYHGIMGGGIGVAESLVSAFFGILVLIVFYTMGGVGAGDVKLLAAIGAWLKLPLTFWVFIASSLAAGVYALILIIWTGRTRETWVNLRILWFRLLAVGRHLGAEDQMETELRREDRRGRVIPFAAMMAVGMLSLLGVAWCMGMP